MQKVDRLGWAGTSTFRVGDYEVGVRTNTVGTDRALQGLLRPHWTPGVASDRHYSLQINEPQRSGTFPYHFLFRGCTPVARSRHATTVVENLVGRLDELATEKDPDDLRLQMTAFVREDRAMLLPAWVGRAHHEVGQLRRAGFLPVGTAYAHLDADSGDLHVREPTLVTAPSYLEAWREGSDEEHRPAQRIPAGRYPVRALYLLDRTGDDAVASNADALARSLMTVENRTLVDTGRVLRALASMVTHSHPQVLPRSEKKVTAFVLRTVRA